MDANIQTPLVLFVYIVTFVIGVPSNLLAFYTFLAKVRQKPNPIGIFFLNLTISDLSFLFFLPFKMVEAASEMRWPMPYFLCPIVVMVYFCSIYISMLFLAAVSVERYLGVAYPMKYRAYRKPVYAIWACVFIWVFSSLQGSATFIVLKFLPSNESSQEKCYEKFSEEQLKVLMPYRLEVSLVLFCIPYVITVFCYVNFVRLLISMPKIRGKKRYRAVGLAVATLCNFTICFAPYNISHIVGFIQNKSPHWRVYALLLTTLNACLDPIIFYYSSTDVQRAFLKCLTEIKIKICKLNSASLPPEQSQLSETRATNDLEGTSV